MNVMKKIIVTFLMIIVVSSNFVIVEASAAQLNSDSLVWI